MKINFPLSDRMVAVSAAEPDYQPLLASLGFGSMHEQPFGDGVLRPRVSVSSEGGRSTFKQSEDDWSGGPEWAKEMRQKAIAAGATRMMQERSREGKTVYAGTWNERPYELTLRRSIGCKESAYFAELTI